LPQSLRTWREMSVVNGLHWSETWESLRPYFKEKGYDLYQIRNPSASCIPNGTPPPPNSDSFGLYGDRGNDFNVQFERYAQAFAARDAQNRNVVIKVVAKENEECRELEILKMLNSEPLKSDPCNATVPVLEFLQCEDYHFAVMPFCDRCEEPPFRNIHECLDFAEQVLRDVAFENIVINHHGKIPYFDLNSRACGAPEPVFRSKFPVKYYFLDFGCSATFSPSSPLKSCLVAPFNSILEQRPQEAQKSKHFNPFAADVYQTARLFYTWFIVSTNNITVFVRNILPDVPGFLELLQDMSSYNPSNRISIDEALKRFSALRSNLPSSADDYEDSNLSKPQSINLLDYYPLVPMGFWRMLRDILQTGDMWLACQFAWYIVKIWCASSFYDTARIIYWFPLGFRNI
ncbi:hypothetical protein SERLA73DRAFT_64892, partial [Serpula lacrymans var. lacrymans S7.3]